MKAEAIAKKKKNEVVAPFDLDPTLCVGFRFDCAMAGHKGGFKVIVSIMQEEKCTRLETTGIGARI